MNLSVRNQLTIGAGLVLLMILTREYHFSSLHSLPGASWAIFFLAGLYLRAIWPLVGLFILTWALDFSAYTWGGASSFCLTSSYVFLLPAYSALWYAGSWYARRYQFEWNTLLPLSLSLMTGAAVCELFSSGGFYFFSGRFEETTLIEFGQRLVQYFPHYVGSLVFYIGIAVAIHIMFTFIQGSFRAHNNRTI
ncbi:MAG: hypothetical protein OSB01_06510 [Nitrosomonadaceae bacterium]|nr:hypothetical protein [Nitrosomonadaceae bacterium]